MSDNSDLVKPWYPPDTDFNPPAPLYWNMAPSYRAGYTHEELGTRDFRPPVINEDELYEARRQLRLANPDAAFFSTLLIPDNFLRPHILLASELWSDLISMGGYWLFSRRLRDAMALPEAAAQFFPIDLETESEALRAKDYRWLSRLNTQQGLIDPERSTSTWETETRHSTGEEFPVIDDRRTMVVRSSFQPDFDLFKPFEVQYLLCATDALQARVIAAGCLGVGFRAFGTMTNVPWWLSDEDGKRVIDPNRPFTDLGIPAAVLLERPDLIPRGDIH